ncbi:MerR family transcriptional regulator [Flavimarina sp. Hel_I_48]|uniref:MerR family transcriptional regulator n=1 Tax=Flavimarina sp. Hel_I_48 TaxID=1392488 RepID=UPI0004DEE123|nr:MerR family transcriptional regulator [Flavimarina sp. Hel_I_48]
MNAVKTKFSIKDLENLAGVKAHTIRIWEKRYNLLEPDRTPTNIRTYTLKDLQKLLNVTFLLEHNYKISKIAQNDNKAIIKMVKQIVEQKEKPKNHQALNSFKIAMMNFDQQLFAKTFDSLSDKLQFRDIFYQVLIPLLEEIGLLWQTNTIDPSHEHFITNLIKQKILLKIEEYQIEHIPDKSKVFVLFLPENEIHDLGLLFLNYEIVSHGYKCIYLGQSIMIENLKYLNQNQPNVHFVSYFTVKPEDTSVSDYVKIFNKEMENDHIPLYIFGRKALRENIKNLPSNAQVIKSIDSFIEDL